LSPQGKHCKKAQVPRFFVRKQIHGYWHPVKKPWMNLKEM